MLKEHIVVGGSYVNERAGIIREVVEELDRQRVKFNAFDLATGRLIPAPPQVCQRSQMARWADREVRQPERDRVHPYEQDRWFGAPLPREQEAAGLEQAKTALEAVPGHHVFPRVK